MLRALVLGAVQGLTEFIPVSSSGHLVLVPFVLDWGQALGSDVGFDIALHLGTAIAILVYFWKDLWAIVRGVSRIAGRRGDDEDRAHAALAGLLVIGSIPAAVVGITLEDPLTEVFEHPPIVAALLLGTATLLLLADWVYRRRPDGRRGVEGVGWKDAVVIGTLQALAILPGISRSGATIAAGVGRGLTREAAARFSFLLGLPAILGAALVSLPDLEDTVPLSWVISASALAAVTGLLAIGFLLRFLRRGSLTPFAVYLVLASLGALSYWLVTR